jgi:hypothetical protein
VPRPTKYKQTVIRNWRTKNENKVRLVIIRRDWGVRGPILRYFTSHKQTVMRKWRTKNENRIKLIIVCRRKVQKCVSFKTNSDE